MLIIIILIFFELDINYFFNDIKTNYIFLAKLFKLLIIAIFKLILFIINFYLTLLICFFLSLKYFIRYFKKIVIFLDIFFYYFINNKILYNFNRYYFYK